MRLAKFLGVSLCGCAALAPPALASPSRAWFRVQHPYLSKAWEARGLPLGELVLVSHRPEIKRSMKAWAAMQRTERSGHLTYGDALSIVEAADAETDLDRLLRVDSHATLTSIERAAAKTK